MGRRKVDSPERLTSEQTEVFLGSADQRGVELFHEIDLLLEELTHHGYRAKAYTIRRDLEWLRDQAFKKDYYWGRPKPSWRERRSNRRR